jgi:oligosaccharyltransferase complex subunit gamma
MLSGHMWVKIRNPPYIGPNKLYVMKSSPQAQFGVESKLVAALTAAVTAIVLLVVPITYKFDDVNKRRIAAMILSLMYMAAHSGLLKIFAMKFPGYPLSYIF